jgi:hypothetical protein
LVRGVKKDHKNTLQKVHVENFPQTNRQNFDVSFPSTFLFYRVFGRFSVRGVQKKKSGHVTFCVHPKTTDPTSWEVEVPW